MIPAPHQMLAQTLSQQTKRLWLDQYLPGKLVTALTPPVEIQRAIASMRDPHWDQWGACQHLTIPASRFTHYVGCAEQIVFANRSETLFAFQLDLCEIPWDREVETFMFSGMREGARTQGFLPDFYLPEYGLHIELTTSLHGGSSGKDFKIHLMAEQFPNVRVLLLTRGSLAACLTHEGDLISLLRKIYTHQRLRVEAHQRKFAAKRAELSASWPGFDPPSAI